jgi:predicted RNA binding protein YcfA (HicA-like mRNA interferase family)
MKVKELIKILEKEGWKQARMRGGHRQYRHLDKGGLLLWLER